MRQTPLSAVHDKKAARKQLAKSLFSEGSTGGRFQVAIKCDRLFRVRKSQIGHTQRLEWFVRLCRDPDAGHEQRSWIVQFESMKGALSTSPAFALRATTG